MSIKLPRVGIPQEIHSKYKLYTKNDETKEGGVFRFSTMADIFILAALIGFFLNQYKPFTEADKIERPFKWDVFLNNDYHIQIIKSISLLHIKETPKEANVLLDNEKMAVILEGYANGGIYHLVNELENGIDIEGNIINLIKKFNELTFNIEDY
jgi:dnd system-associated protein 4